MNGTREEAQKIVEEIFEKNWKRWQYENGFSWWQLRDTSKKEILDALYPKPESEYVVLIDPSSGLTSTPEAALTEALK